MKAKSDRRRQLDRERAKVREVVRENAGAETWTDLSACQYREITPQPCGWLPGRREMEVDELRGGAHRSIEWLNPDRCRYVCPRCHDFKTDHKRDVLDVLALLEGSTPWQLPATPAEPTPVASPSTATTTASCAPTTTPTP